MAVKGKGAKLWLWDAALATPALVQVTELVSVTPPDQTRDTIDTTHHGSTGDFREFISSLMDAGEATGTIHYEPDSTADELLVAVLSSGDLTAFAIDVNNGAGTQQRISGSAILTSYAPADVVIDDKMTATITLKVSGPLVRGAVPGP